MKCKLLLIAITLFIIIIAAGCNNNEEQYSSAPTIEGYIMNAEDDYILVVSGINENQAINKNWNDLSQEEQKKYTPHSFKPSGFFNDFSDLKKGDEVKVWAVDGASESYPPQSKVGKIEKLN